MFRRLIDWCVPAAALHLGRDRPATSPTSWWICAECDHTFCILFRHEIDKVRAELIGHFNEPITFTSLANLDKIPTVDDQAFYDENGYYPWSTHRATWPDRLLIDLEE